MNKQLDVKFVLIYAYLSISTLGATHLLSKSREITSGTGIGRKLFYNVFMFENLKLVSDCTQLLRRKNDTVFSPFFMYGHSAYFNVYYAGLTSYGTLYIYTQPSDYFSFQTNYIFLELNWKNIIISYFDPKKVLIIRDFRVIVLIIITVITRYILDC